MSETTVKSRIPLLLLGQLRHPLKLRLALGATMLGAWYFAYFSPLADRIAVTTATTARERSRITTARDIETLRKSLHPYRDRVPAKSDNNELIQHVMDHIRPTPIRLMDLKPEKPKDIGPFEAASLRLVFEGSFADLAAFLTWVQTNQRLTRIDSLSVIPNSNNTGKLSIQLTLLGLAEKDKPRDSERTGKK